MSMTAPGATLSASVRRFLNHTYDQWQIASYTLDAPREDMTTMSFLMGLYPAGTAPLTSDGKEAAAPSANAS